MTRILRCGACYKRIRPTHPHIGLIDHEAGTEISYHARRNCQSQGVAEMASLLECGRVYILRHYHSSTCPDRAPGWGCTGGCFDAPSFAVAN
jgi:hypothetical protein